MIRIPPPVQTVGKAEPPNVCGKCCRATLDCCIACGAHGWFLTLFCGYILVSSLPRILTILDFVITLSIYLTDNNSQNAKHVNRDVSHYHFTHSTFDVVIISLIRSIILFICFAYRYQREGFRKNIYVAGSVVLVSSAYLAVKYYMFETHQSELILFSLFFVFIECTFFFLVRRRRIRYQPSRSGMAAAVKGPTYYYSTDNREDGKKKRKTMRSKRGMEYHRFGDNGSSAADEDNDTPLIAPTTAAAAEDDVGTHIDDINNSDDDGEKEETNENIVVSISHDVGLARQTDITSPDAVMLSPPSDFASPLSDMIPISTRIKASASSSSARDQTSSPVVVIDPLSTIIPDLSIPNKTRHGGADDASFRGVSGPLSVAPDLFPAQHPPTTSSGGGNSTDDRPLLSNAVESLPNSHSNPPLMQHRPSNEFKSMEVESSSGSGGMESRNPVGTTHTFLKKAKRGSGRGRFKRKKKDHAISPPIPSVRSRSQLDVREQSLSVISSVPDAEFSDLEQPLRAPNSAFWHVNGVAIHYRMELGNGEPNAPFIVLIHGFGGGLFSWKRVWDDFKEVSSGLLAFDRPGFGLTERPLSSASSAVSQETWDNDDDNPYSIEFALQIVKILLDKFEITNAFFIGHSTGCTVCSCMSYIYPQYVRGMILASPSTGMPGFIRSILKTKLGRPIIMQLVRSEIGQVTLHQAWHNPTKVPRQVISAYRAVLKLAHWDEGLVEMARIKKPHHFVRNLSKVTCPVWILHGDDDKLVTYSECHTMANKFQRCVLVRMKRCGHIPHEEVPREFVRIASLILENALASLTIDSHSGSHSHSHSGSDSRNGSENNTISHPQLSASPPPTMTGARESRSRATDIPSDRDSILVDTTLSSDNNLQSSSQYTEPSSRLLRKHSDSFDPKNERISLLPPPK